TTTISNVTAPAALLAFTVTVPGVGSIPVVQADVATCPGVMARVQLPNGGNVDPVQLSVVMLVPVGKDAGVTVSAVVVYAALVFVMVISLALPVNAAFE